MIRRKKAVSIPEFKYDITDIESVVDGHKLYRIRSLKQFECPYGVISKGDLGGFVESYDNLSQEGTCWVGDLASVYEKAFVCDDACIYGMARVHGRAEVEDSAQVYGSAEVCGSALIYDEAYVYDSSKVCGRSKVGGTSCIYKSAVVSGTADIGNNDEVYYNIDS